MLITFQILVCSKNISVIVLIQAVIKGEVLLLNVKIEISRMEFDDTSSDSSKCQYITVSLPMKNVNVKSMTSVTSNGIPRRTYNCNIS